jgi:glycosyltransferase involved in cell wall biosynthesis
VRVAVRTGILGPARSEAAPRDVRPATARFSRATGNPGPLWVGDRAEKLEKFAVPFRLLGKRAMTVPPRISIVTPSYNQAAFVGETIESVLSQAGDFEVEYFVMDGGSTDGAVDVIRRYAGLVAEGRWPVRCRGIALSWVSERDDGQSAAINAGLRRATGEILGYINSDDLYFPGAFQRVVEVFQNDSAADVVYGDGDVIDAAGARQWEWLSRPYNHRVMTSYHFLWNDFSNYILQQATFWRRRVREQIGDFDPTLHFAMDVEYWIRAGATGLRLRHLPEKLGKFRMIAGTKSLSNPTVFWEDYLEIFRRYRRVGLADFFAFYYYNLARQFGGDVLRATHEGARVFERWRGLTPSELAALTRDADRGQALARVLLARDLQRQGAEAEANAMLCLALAKRPGLALRPLALGVVLRRLVGRSGASALDRWTERAIRQYRRKRFDYRYVHGR